MILMLTDVSVYVNFEWYHHL